MSPSLREDIEIRFIMVVTCNAIAAEFAICLMWIWWIYVYLHCSLGYNLLTNIGALALARALQHNKSLEKLKWVINWVSCCQKVIAYIIIYCVWTWIFFMSKS